jgi:phosphatidylglycerophosphatase A
VGPKLPLECPFAKEDTLVTAVDRQPDSKSPFQMGTAVFFATGGWVGLLAPFAPGTFGALWGLLLAWGLSRIPGDSLVAATVQGLAILAVAAIGVPLCTAAARRLGGKDPQMIVWDEIPSVPMTFFLVPPELMNRPVVLAAGFLLNRFFDIVKVPPAKQMERLPEGLGIMADDWVAGVYALLALRVLLHFHLLPGVGG